MRRGIAVLLVFVFLGGALSVVDVLVKAGVETAMADQIEAVSPGATAKVKIRSFPFVGSLALSGDVPEIRIEVEGVDAGGLVFSSIALDLHSVRVDRHQLSRGGVVLTGIGAGRVAAVISESDIDAVSHLQIVLGAGTVEVGGVVGRVRTSVDGKTITFRLRRLPAFSITIPALEVLPCIGTVTVVPGALDLGCSFRGVPAALAGHVFQA